MMSAVASNDPRRLCSSSLVHDQASWLKIENELAEQGITPPLFHRWAWFESSGHNASKLFVVRDPDGRLMGACVINEHSSRVLPGHILLRVSRFGDPMPEAAVGPMVKELRWYARNRSRTLRLSVELFSFSRLGTIAHALENEGFRRADQIRSYQQTLVLDLTPDLKDVFAGLHKTARKNLSPAATAKTYAIPLTETRFADRVNQLNREALERTGGTHKSFNAVAALQLSKSYPNLSLLVGLFQTHSEPIPENLIGFAWGCIHGTHAEYRAAGTARLENQNIAISYPLLWEVISWAKRHGAVMLDLGGIPLNDSPTDPLHGISTFKRFFSRRVEVVGDEWMFEPHPMRARLADFLGRMVKKLAQRPHRRHDKALVAAPQHIESQSRAA